MVKGCDEQMLEGGCFVPLTRNEFEEDYAKKSGVSVEWLHQHDQHGCVCSCGEEGCQGWQMKGNIMEIKKLYSFCDWRGDLTPLEFSDLPFVPQRLFIVKNVEKGIKRGEHAHHKTRQFLICIRGEIKVVTHNGIKYDETVLIEGQTALIEPYHWDWQEFLTGDDILLVVCSTPFDLNDYILNFNSFLEISRRDGKK